MKKKTKIQKFAIIYVICFIIGVAIGAVLLGFNDIYKSPKEVNIISVTDNTISYIDSYNNGDPSIKTVPKPKFGKYQAEDKIYINEKTNKVAKVHFNETDINTIHRIGEIIITITLLLPLFIIVGIIFLAFIYNSKGIKRNAKILLYIGTVMLILCQGLDATIVAYIAMTFIGISIILLVVSNIDKKK